jgi:MFS family permease
MASADPSRLPLRFWIAALVAFINAVGFTLIIPLIYPYAMEFGLSDFQASLLTTAYAAAQFVATPILGRLSDRMGRKPLLIVSLLGTVAANLMAGLAPVAWVLFVARLLDGITGGNTSIAQAIVSDITTPEQRARAYGIFGALSAGVCGGATAELRGAVGAAATGVYQPGHGVSVFGGDRPICHRALPGAAARNSRDRLQQVSVFLAGFWLWSAGQVCHRQALWPHFLADLL